MTNTEDKRNEAIVKGKQYDTPVLTEYGAAAQLTLGGTQGSGEHGSDPKVKA